MRPNWHPNDLDVETLATRNADSSTESCARCTEASAQVVPVEVLEAFLLLAVLLLPVLLLAVLLVSALWLPVLLLVVLLLVVLLLVVLLLVVVVQPHQYPLFGFVFAKVD